MTLPELIAKRDAALADAKFHHEQGCFSCFTECQEKARELEAEINRRKEQDGKDHNGRA